MKPVILTIHKWNVLIKQLHNDYPCSVVAIREKTKKVLGFTSRAHREWIENPTYDEFMKQYGPETIHGTYMIPPSKGHYDNFIHLDFYDDAKRTFFLLKYSEFL